VNLSADPGFPLSHSPDSLRRKENRIQEKSLNPKGVYTKLLTPPTRQPDELRQFGPLLSPDYSR
jgi:hypothetical protein